MKVLYGEKFRQHLKNFPKADQLKIKAFADHVQTHGLIGLIGRNKSSDNVPKDHPNWLERVKYAQTHHLWHYHIGIPSYDNDNPDGDKTSKYVLHYIRHDDEIILVDLSAHPPLELPSQEYLTTID